MNFNIVSQLDKSLYSMDAAAEQAELWKNFKSGDSASLGKLAQLHYRALYNYATKFSADPDFISDCLQEMYLELWERRDYLSETPFVKSYLFKALRHKLIKESARLKRFSGASDDLFSPIAVTQSIETAIIENEQETHQKNKIKHILSNLTRRQQEIIYLRFYQNLEYDDIAGIMGVGKQSIANLIYRSLKEIKECWLAVEYLIGLVFFSFY